MSFRVICLVQCKTKLLLIIFSSGSGAEQWRAVTFDNWISLLTGSGIMCCKMMELGRTSGCQRQRSIYP
uniref:Secreted protein n=1 Tax=Triticum urartu TaxID=4572 RepID=A0A8R7TDP3_TRIUA